ncbi:protein ANTAGONIST OF LIKE HETEROCHROMATIN PROTEIN 1-like [Lucilia sericata]|uniref:protein ANTAGONIST OF LIKE HETEROCHROMATIN PROTEIN 1-like n=1 Tax=Lucilia sericata TaxID=13632 RepID=UPI0018A87B4C|nr:protein ANTAGONIST OF LIKE HETEROCHROMATIN PROTEIN 1-like [Lucilia sericata]
MAMNCQNELRMCRRNRLIGYCHSEAELSNSTSPCEPGIKYMYGCHIEVHPASEDAVDYYDYKGWYSTVLLALVDYRYRFLYINVGSPGRCNDSQIYERSLLKKHISESDILDQYSKDICGTKIPIYIIGDSAFRFSKNLMKPYPFNANNDSRRKKFNYLLSKHRRVVENAFGHLKARFRRVGKGIDNKIQNVNLIIKTCCLLHNFLNENNDNVNNKWLKDLEQYDKLRKNLQNQTVLDDTINDAEQIRHALSLYALRTVSDVKGESL